MAAKVLIIDDAVTVRAFHRQILESCGLEVDEAANGVEALEKALQIDFALYLVDVNMPKMDGYRFIETVRAEPRLHDIPAIMVSTESEPHDRERAFRCGASVYLVKPVQPVTLHYHAQILIGVVPS